MLNTNESKVMRVLYFEGQKKNPFLISPEDLLNLSEIKNFSLHDLENVLTNLAIDGYFDIIYSERQSQRVYCFTLLKKGKAFMRERKQAKRNVLMRIVLSAGLAVMSFLIGLLLKAIF